MHVRALSRIRTWGKGQIYISYNVTVSQVRIEERKRIETFSLVLSFLFLLLLEYFYKQKQSHQMFDSSEVQYVKGTWVNFLPLFTSFQNKLISCGDQLGFFTKSTSL